MRRTAFPPELRRALALLVLSPVLAGLTACGLAIPADPDGTLDAVTGGVIRIGVSAEPGLVDVSGPVPSGSLVAVTEDFAASVDARPSWVVGSEETLVADLEHDRIDLAIGGFTTDTPWLDRVGVSRGYTGIAGADGRSLVVLVPLGENAMLAAVERFLDEEVGG